MDCTPQWWHYTIHFEFIERPPVVRKEINTQVAVKTRRKWVSRVWRIQRSLVKYNSWCSWWATIYQECYFVCDYLNTRIRMLHLQNLSSYTCYRKIIYNNVHLILINNRSINQSKWVLIISIYITTMACEVDSRPLTMCAYVRSVLSTYLHVFIRVISNSCKIEWKWHICP